jgi:hypothetical protein
MESEGAEAWLIAKVGRINVTSGGRAELPGRAIGYFVVTASEIGVGDLTANFGGSRMKILVGLEISRYFLWDSMSAL